MNQAKKLLFVVCAVALVSVLAAPAGAQTQITTGVIQGTVSDPSAALVPDAEVEAKNLDTNFTRTVTTDENGRFVFLQLPPGRYTVTVKKQGFATLVQENLTLTVGQAINLSLTMKVSTAAETITVTATAVVDTTRTEVSNTLNQATVSTTPILGRKFEDLLTLTPGVSIVQGPDGDEINFNGQRGIFNNISLDGGDYNNGFFGEQPGGQRAAIDITLEAVKEFQVIPTGSNAEFGRTAGGVINVITKSGTNELHGSFFYFQRLEALTSDNSDGTPNTDFHREQFGGTIGGPIVKDKSFFFAAVERITANLERANLSAPMGTCPTTGAAIIASAASIAANGNTGNNNLSNAECQRQALVEFMSTQLGNVEDLPVRRPVFNTAFLGKWDWLVTASNNLAVSYNHNSSKKVNETFDVATYGNSANGIEGRSRINILNANLFTTVSPTKLNEFHFTYSRESRPRAAVSSNLSADTGVGFAPSFRFGDPFFLQPTIDELIWRIQFKDNFSIVAGRHTIKFGGEYLHTLNDQIFRGFFTGRYLFGSVEGFLRYASPQTPAVAGFGPGAAFCTVSNVWVDSSTTFFNPADFNNYCDAAFTDLADGPLLLYLQGAGLTGPATDAAGASRISNNEWSFFAQDKWQIHPHFTLNYGLRWEAQLMPDTVDPTTTAYGIFLTSSGGPTFPSNGKIPDQTAMWQPRLGFAWDIQGRGKTVFRGNAGIYNARQNMLTQVGSVTTNGRQQSTIVAGTFFNTAGGPPPTWPGLVTPPSVVTPCVGTLGSNPFPCGTGVRVFHSDYHNPRIYTWNLAFEQELAPDWSAYFDFTYSKGVFLTRFINFNRSDAGSLFNPYLGEVMVANSFGQSLYRGATFGVRKRFAQGFQMEGNYVLAWDYDDDSNERDPFTDRAIDFNNLRADYGFSDRDIRHKFNFFTYAELPWALQANLRMQARSAQPISPSPRTPGSRNTLRKDNEYFSFDWRVQRPFKIGERWEIIPIFEMFNTFNNENNINPLTTPGLFNFDGFLRLGVGDPRQAQFAFKVRF